ncbi:MAG: helix-turn-helix transcriptional regulator [Sphingomonadales bacterium]|nr:helix-turn-helix transcriptional regulator [Sphingomonadales bacterium]MBK6492532.1 helix-turn-helix transcriptional regulator [Sphingomonadales bacterium]MBK6720596.1 helix-turn-helix transcriptional regulator [Sphingomonadales bacterium]MBK8273779.1 helix-turn-helix transcriptional regulator [Sphingomonadales bacterium]MBK8861178.1 helix-turn-helix transcriptional regulator [Sphingomonadales bacterium]
MQEPIHPTVRQLRRRYGLTQDDVATLLGSRCRKSIAKLESGDRVPHMGEAVLLSWLFETPPETLFPGVYLTTREHFRSNMDKLLARAAAETGSLDSDRLICLRRAIATFEMEDNLAPLGV